MPKSRKKKDIIDSPSDVLLIRFFPDGNMWCAMVGENLQEGRSGFGKTPAKALKKLAKDFEDGKPWTMELGNVRIGGKDA